MRFLWVAVFLLAIMLVSAMDARPARKKRSRRPPMPLKKFCTSNTFSGYRMVFPKRSIRNYALKRKAFPDGLKAVTLCFFAKDNPNESSNQFQCPYSYAVPGARNELSLCTSPTLRVMVNGEKRDTDVSIEDGNFHHICFTWSSSIGGYQLYKDGTQVARGMGLKSGHTIPPGGTVVLGQDQNRLAGDFDPQEAFVGELTGVNVWDKVLPRRVIVRQHNSCRIITKGTVNWWSQFKAAVHGGVQIVKPTRIFRDHD